MNFLPFIKKKPALEEAVPTPVEEEVPTSVEEEVSAPAKDSNTDPSPLDNIYTGSIESIKNSSTGKDIVTIMQTVNKDNINYNEIKDKIEEITRLYYSHKAKYYFNNAILAGSAKIETNNGKKNMEDAMLGLWILALYQLKEHELAENLKNKFGNFNAMKHDVTKPYIKKLNIVLHDGHILGPFMTFLGGERGGVWFSNKNDKHKPEKLKEYFNDDGIKQRINHNDKGWDKLLETYGDKIKNDAKSLLQNGGRKLKKTLKKKSKKGKKTMKQKGKKSNKKVVKKHKKTMKKKKGRKHKTRKHK